MKPERRLRARQAEARYREKNLEKVRAAQRDRANKKSSARRLRGHCRSCDADAVSGRMRCAYHLDIERLRSTATRERRLQNGMCSRSGCSAERTEGRAYCDEHLEEQRKGSARRRRELNAKGLCARCGREPNRSGKLYCDLCAHDFSARCAGYTATIEERKAFWAGQGAACAICRVLFADIFSGSIDHDHHTGALRGLLCDSCNLGLGMFKDSSGLLTAAVLYLSQPKDSSPKKLDEGGDGKTTSSKKEIHHG